MSQLALRVGKTISAKGQLRLAFPPEINNIFGQTNGQPNTKVLNTEWLFTLGYDDKLGLSLQMDTLPINLDAAAYIKPEVEHRVDGDRTWQRFALGPASFRFGSFIDDATTGAKWIHVDFGALGEVRFQPPRFSFDGANFSASGSFDVVSDQGLRIP